MHYHGVCWRYTKPLEPIQPDRCPDDIFGDPAETGRGPARDVLAHARPRRNFSLKFQLACVSDTVDAQTDALLLAPWSIIIAG